MATCAILSVIRCCYNWIFNKVVEEESNTMNEIRLVVLGHTGVGKSSTCNSLVMDKTAFKTSVSATSETKRSDYKQVNEGLLDRNLVVVDTPGLFDTNLGEESTIKEIAKCMICAAPGPHAFMYVIQIGVRFTGELQKTLQRFRQIFGADFSRHMLIVFCGVDKFEEDEDTQAQLEEYLKNAPPDLAALIRDCGRRFVGFNNKCRKDSKENQTQVRNLIDMVQKIIDTPNLDSFYTNDMFKEAERVLQEREAKKREEEERKKSEEKKEMVKKVEQEFEKAVKEMEKKFDDEKQKIRGNLEKKKTQHTVTKGKEKPNQPDHASEAKSDSNPNIESANSQAPPEEIERQLDELKTMLRSKWDQIKKEREEKIDQELARRIREIRDESRELTMIKGDDSLTSDLEKYLPGWMKQNS